MNLRVLFFCFVAGGIIGGGFMAEAANPDVVVLQGRARVVDGDTLRIKGEKIRLHGIDAPEAHQLCYLGERKWACGKSSARELMQKINEKTVTCYATGKDRYKRFLATCEVEGANINQWMVRRGFALAYSRYSTAYLPSEAQARREAAGVWKSRFREPWIWRSRSK